MIDDTHVLVVAGDVARQIRDAVAVERAECAALADAESCEYALAHPDVCCGCRDDGEHEAASRIAAAIRARAHSDSSMTEAEGIMPEDRPGHEHPGRQPYSY